MNERNEDMSNEEVVQHARDQIAAQVDWEQAETGLDVEDYQRTLQRAVHYRGLTESDAEAFLRNAMETIEEVQIGFANSIQDQVQRAEMIIDDIAGTEPSLLERPPVEEVVRYINTQFVDSREANQAVDEAAIKMGQVFRALRSAAPTE